MKKIKNINVLIILFLYIFLEIFFVKYIPSYFTYIINPLFFIGLSIYLKIVNSYDRTLKEKEYIKNMIIVMLMYFIVFEGLGLILGFAKNAYSRSFISIIKNVWILIVPIIGIEYIRSSLINENSKNKLVFIITSLIFFLIEINVYNIFYNCTSREKTFIYIAGTLIPMLTSSFLYSYLVIIGGYKLSLTYRIMMSLIALLVPIVPKLNWFSNGIIGIVFPTIVYLLFKFYYEKKNKNLKKRNRKAKNPIVYIPIFALIILLTSFMLGLFSYMPIAVVSDSMNPIFYRGDVVIMRKVNKKSFKSLDENDIIIYRMDNKLIIHRIINIEKHDNGQVYYQTKGDNNKSPDLHLVTADEISGIYITSVKYIGYPSVWLSEFFRSEKPNVEMSK